MPTNQTMHATIDVDVIGTAELRQFNSAAAQAARETNRMNQQARWVQASMGGFNGAMRGVSYQIQDVAVQLAMGTNSMMVMTQQAPQLLSVLGRYGPAIGALVAVGAGLVTYFQTAADATESFKDATDGLDSAMSSARTAIDRALQPLSDWNARTADAAQNMRDLSEISAGAGLVKVQAELRKVRDEFAGFTDTTTTPVRNLAALFDEIALEVARVGDEADVATPQLDRMRAELASMETQLGMTAAQAKEFVRLSNEMATALEMGGSSDTIENIGRDMLYLLQNTEGANAELADLVQRAVEGKLTAEQFANEMARLEGNTRAATGSMANLSVEARKVVTSVSAAASALSALQAGIDSIDVQIASQRAFNDAIERGTSLIKTQSEARIAAKRAELNVALGSEDRAIRLQAAADLDVFIAKEAELVVELERAKAAQDAATASTSAGGRASRSAATASRSAAAATREYEQSVTALNNALQAFRSPYEQAIAAQKEFSETIAKVGGVAKLTAEQLALYNRAIVELQLAVDQAKPGVQELSDIMENNIGGAFDSLVDGTKSASEAFTDMITGMLQDITKFLFSKQINNFLKLLTQTDGFGSTAGWLTSTATASSGGLVSPAPPAPGAPFFAPPPAPAPYVVRMPTLSPQYQKLGASGGRGDVNVNVTNNAPVDVRTETRRTADGGYTVELMIEEKVKSMVTNGSLDRSLQNSYGIRRKPG